MNYQDFIKQKKHSYSESGFSPLWMPDFLFDFQKFMVEWALKKGRGALYEDCGLGKTPQLLVWAENIVRKTNKNVLILTPLAVSHQTVTEGEKFGIEVKRSRDGQAKGKITVTNYQQLEKFNSNDYIGVVCDESSILKNFEGHIKTAVTRFMNKLPYRLLCTATPSPNDYVELGTSSEGLGELKYMDMVSQFFRDTSNDKNPQWSTPKYILKGHAREKFWQWVCSWARACKKPSDLGFNDKDFILPPLEIKEHILQCTKPLPNELFVRKAITLRDQKNERKMTIEARAGETLKLCNQNNLSVVWVDYNYEADYLEKNIDGSVQVSGQDSDEEKEEKLLAFTNSQIKILIMKPSIGAFGLNWQHCNHTVFYPSHSYERYYQGIRRFYRFGQKNKVVVDIVTTEGEVGVYHNIKRKSDDADKMFSMLIKFMNNVLHLKNIEQDKEKINLPNWLKREV